MRPKFGGPVTFLFITHPDVAIDPAVLGVVKKEHLVCRSQGWHSRFQRRLKMAKTIGFVLALAAASPALASEQRSFDWDRYHARQDACAEKDRIATQCEIERSTVFNSFVRRGSPERYCDVLALRQATLDCSAFGPLDEGRL